MKIINNKFEKYPNKFEKFIGIHIVNQYQDKKIFNYIKGAIRKLSLDKKAYFVFISDGISRRGKKLQQEIDAENIASELNRDSYEFYDYKNHWEMCALLEKLDLVITSKLHVGIVSTALETSVISLPYHTKTIRYYEQIDAKERCLENPTSEKEVYDHILRFYDHKEIDVPNNVLSSSRSVFMEMYSFIDERADNE